MNVGTVLRSASSSVVGAGGTTLDVALVSSSLPGGGGGSAVVTLRSGDCEGRGEACLGCYDCNGRREADERARASVSTRPAVSMVAVKREVLVELERIEELAGWAVDEDDEDVAAVCERAFSGDIAMWQQALEWWSAWAPSRGREG